MQSNESKPRHEWWREAYRANRYARHLTQGELNARVRDVIRNIIELSPGALTGLVPMDEDGDLWMQRWTHILEEMQFRFGPNSWGFSKDLFAGDPLPDFSGDAAKRALAAAEKAVDSGGALFKFGKSRYMQALHQHGFIRVQPASFYRSLTHNGAIRDDELALRISIAVSTEELEKVVVNPSLFPPEDLDHRINATLGVPSDYWLYCMTSRFSPRLFVDFDANACVIVRDRDEFERRLLTAAATTPLSQADLLAEKVTYVDPIVPPRPTEILVPVYKHFRYSYQRESRFAWLPREEEPTLAAIDLSLGSLTDIADIVLI